MKLLFVTLGCAKNTVDSERMLYLLQQAGYTPTVKTDEAEVAVVNTCAFLESARQEAVDQILELAAFKTMGRLRTLVVAGCLPQLVRDEVMTELPEVDGIVGCGQTERVVDIVNAAVAGEKRSLLDNLDSAVVAEERTLSTPPSTAYLKVSEGCDNRCAYCLIPSIRGPFRSAPMEQLVAQAERLVADGVRELIVVSQDTTRYGVDLYGQPSLVPLLRRLCAIDGLRWLRLHYLYPSLIDDELIELVAEQPKVVKYLDIPIQHADTRILAAMNRRDTADSLDALFTKLRQRIDGLVLRTTVMTGFPGEDDAAFDTLAAFLKKHECERAGVFAFSCEEGTAAASLPDPVDHDVAVQRQQQLQLLQNDIMDGFNARQLGRTLEVLCEGYDRLAECWFGRSGYDSPEVDGKVFFTSAHELSPGDFVAVRITDTLDGDLCGETLGLEETLC